MARHMEPAVSANLATTPSHGLVASVDAGLMPSAAEQVLTGGKQ